MQYDDETLYATMRPARGGKSLVSLSTFEERQDALKNTPIMEDEVNHRASRNFAATEANNGKQKIATNRNENAPNGQQLQMPPPPPQFANSPPRANQVTNTYKTTQQTPTNSIVQKVSPTGAAMALKPPSSPVPDYDNVEIRAHTTRTSYGYTSVSIASNTRESVSTSGTRRTMRLGTVTIGEYEQYQRKEPGKFDFIATQNNNSNSNNNNVNNHNNNETESLHTELQNTLTRSKLKKNSNEPLEHQSNCPMRNSYENNYENVTRKLQGTSLTGKAKLPANGANTTSTSAAAASLRNGQNGGNAGTNGILKNGNRNSGANFTKNSDKTITFGN